MNGLRERRKIAGFSLLGFALITATEPAMLSMIERGKRCTQKTAKRLAKALKTDPRSIWPDFDTMREGG